MSQTRFDNVRGSIPGVLLAAAAVVIVALGAVLAMSMKGPSTPDSALAEDEGLRISLAVQPFEVGDSVPGTWEGRWCGIFVGSWKRQRFGRGR